ncbi:MAG: hypothetical protein NUV56_04940 [Candidatus Uhrbacteria bacterium]|nr:hypothetical protein [Candidatus Uhrbacteria bacterium]
MRFTLFLTLITLSGCGWLTEPFRVASVDNVREQFRFAYEYDESLAAIAKQACSTQNAIDGATSDDEKSQRRTQLLAIEQNYARVEADFNAKLRDAFEAKYVAPADVPSRALGFEAMKRRECGS